MDNDEINVFTRDVSVISQSFGIISIDSGINIKEANHLKKMFIKCKMLSMANLEGYYLMQKLQNMLIIPYVIINGIAAIINTDLGFLFDNNYTFKNFIKYITITVLIINIFFNSLKDKLKINKKIEFYKNKYTKYKSICNLIEKYTVSGENTKTYDLITSSYNEIYDDNEFILPERIIIKSEKLLKSLNITKKHKIEIENKSIKYKKNDIDNDLKNVKKIFEKNIENEIDEVMVKIDELLITSPRVNVNKH